MSALIDRRRTMLSRRGLLVGIAAAGFILPANAAYLPITQAMLNALDFGVVGDGSTSDVAASQAFVNTCSTRGAIAFFPGRTYDFKAGSVVVPDNTTVFCASGATFVRSVEPPSYATVQTITNTMWRLGNNCRFYNGTLTKTSVLGTSTSSVAVGTGSKSFTVPTGLNILTGDFMRFWSTPSPVNYIEGSVTSYNSGTGALVLNANFTGGAGGTFGAWTFDWEGVYQTPLSLDHCNGTLVDGTTISGPWYEGFLFDGENASGFTLSCSNSVVRNSRAIGILNRAFDVYGNIARCKILGNTVDGQNGTTDYGCNLNAANNPAGQGQTVVDCVISDNTIFSTQFQGIAGGDSVYRTVITNNSINIVSNAAGVGIELVYANGNSPQWNIVGNNVVQSAAGQGLALFGALYTNVTNFTALSCGTGVLVQSSAGINSQENNVLDVMVTGCVTGVSCASGSINTYVSGRAANNTTNLSTTGSSGTNTTNLITV